MSVEEDVRYLVTPQYKGFVALNILVGTGTLTFVMLVYHKVKTSGLYKKVFVTR